MKTVWKFPIKHMQHRNVVNMPIGAKWIHAGPDPEDPNRAAAWAIVSTENRRADVHLFAIWTGESIATGGEHIGSYEIDGLMWHVFVSDLL